MKITKSIIFNDLKLLHKLIKRKLNYVQNNSTQYGGVAYNIDNVIKQINDIYQVFNKIKAKDKEIEDEYNKLTNNDTEKKIEDIKDSLDQLAIKVDDLQKKYFKT